MRVAYTLIRAAIFGPFLQLSVYSVALYRLYALIFCTLLAIAHTFSQKCAHKALHSFSFKRCVSCTFSRAVTNESWKKKKKNIQNTIRVLFFLFVYVFLLQTITNTFHLILFLFWSFSCLCSLLTAPHL